MTKTKKIKYSILACGLFILISGVCLGEEKKSITPTREKISATRGYYLGLGPAGLWNLNSSGLGYYFTTGYAFDFDQVAMKLGAEFFGRSGALGLVAGIGVDYFPQALNLEDLTPFVGLDFGYGTSRVNNSDGVFGQWIPGLVLGPSIGVQLFRTTNVNLELAFKWGFFLDSGNLGKPSYSLFKASLYFL